MVEDSTTGNATYYDPDGTQHIFTKTVNNSYIAPQGVYFKLEKPTPTSFRLTDLQTGTYTVFDQRGSDYKISYQVSKNNNRLSFVYASDNTLQSIKVEGDSSTRTINLAMLNGEIDTLTAPGVNDTTTGQPTTLTTKFEYSGTNLTKITAAYGTPDAVSTSYQYGTINGDTTAKYYLNKIIYPNGNEASYSYTLDSSVLGRVTKVSGLNTVQNPGFDLALNNGNISNWTTTAPTGASATLDSDSYSGKNALKLNKTVTGTGIIQTVSDPTTVAANTSYVLSVYGKVQNIASSGGLRGINVKGYDANGQLIFTKSLNVTSADWARYAVSFNSSTATSIKIEAVLDTDVTGSLWLDAFQLQKQVGTVINSEQAWQKIDSQQADWKAGSSQNVSTTANPGSIVLGKVTNDVIKTDTTQTDFQQGTTLTNVYPTTDGKLELQHKTGWTGTWWNRTLSNYDVMDPTATPAISTTYPTIDFTNYTPTTANDYLNAHFEGYLQPQYNEPYTLYVTADDGVRVWFDGSLVIDQWIPQAATTYSWMTPKLEPGHAYKITIEHYERTGSERLLLEWSSISQARQTIPAAQVYSTYETTGTREQTYDISTSGPVSGAVISWNQEQSANSSIQFSTNLSLDGVNWQGWNTISSSASAIPGISAGVDLSHAKLQVRETLNSSVASTTPRLYDLTVKILAAYQSSGTWTSPVYQINSVSNFTQGTISWQQSDNPPTGTNIQIDYRTSADNQTWGVWTTATNGGSIPSQKYVQYRATLTTTNTNVTPELQAVTISYQAGDNVTLVNNGVDSSNNSETISYDTANAATVTDPNGIVSKYEFNQFGNLTKLTDDIGGKNLITSFEYDNRFNLTKMVDSNGEHKYIYDQTGNLINSVDPNGDSVVNAYDQNNNLIRSTEPFPYVSNLILNGDFESTNSTSINRGYGWWGRWWKRTSGNYDTFDTSLPPDLDIIHPVLDLSDVNPGGQTDYYNAHIEGYIVPQTNEAYTLTVTADDGVRLWFNGVLAVDKWILQNGATSYQWTTPVLEAGKPYKVVIEHYECTGKENLKLEWASVSVPNQVVPNNQSFAKYSNFTRPSNGSNPDSPQVVNDTPRFTGNLAYAKAVTNSPNSSVASGTSLARLTDGDLTAQNYLQLNPTDGKAVYAQIDLGGVKSLSKIVVWHYYLDGRTYHNTKTQVSSDGINWVTVFDSAVSGEYSETGNGKVINLSPAMNVQYIRDYLNGSTANQYNHWVEIQAFDAFGQPLLLEENTTNKISTENSGASTDWSKWSFWKDYTNNNNKTYWSSVSQASDPVLGNVFTGINVDSAETFLYDYYPYSLVSGNTYTISVMLKANQNWTGTVTSYLLKNDGTTIAGTASQTVSLNGAWQSLSWTITASQTLTGSAGMGIKLIGLPVGVTIYATRPQFEQKPYATSYTDSSRADETLTINPSVLNQAEGTIEMRVYVNSDIRDLGSNRYIFAYEPSTSTSYPNVLSLRHTKANRWSAWTTNSAGTSSDAYVSDTLTTGWHTFAVRWSSSELALFIDGQKQASVANPALPTINGSSLYVGKWPYDSVKYINTLIDDLRISSRARTDAEISSDYTSGQPLITDSSTTYKMNMDGDLASTSWTADQWSIGNDAGSIANLSFDIATKYFGNQSLRIDKLNSTTRSYAQQTITLVPNTTYTLSGWVKSRNIGTLANQGAYLFIRYQDANGNWIESDSALVNGSLDWQRITQTFTLPTSMLNGNVVIGVALGQSTGTAWFDGVQLEAGSTVHTNNLVNNNSLDVWTNGQLYGWTITPGVYQETLSSNVKDGTGSVKINHDTKVDWRGITSARIPVKPGDELTLSAYVKAAGFVPNENQDLLLRFFASDNTTLIAQDGPQIPAGSYDWARIAKTIRVPLGAYSLEISARIKSSQIATVWLDGIQLQYGNISTSYSYDPYNNQTEEVNQQGDAVNYQYDWYGNLTGQSSAISLNENSLANSSFENLDTNNLPLNWQINGTVPMGASITTDVNASASYSRASNAITENGSTVGNNLSRFYGNILLNLPPSNISFSANSSVKTGTSLSSLVDGNLDTTKYLELTASDSNPVYVQIDLGSVKNLSKILVWHYYGDARKYHATKTQVSADGVNWITLFDSDISGEYLESADGHTVSVNPSTQVRYIRDYVNGSTANSGNHWVEIQAYDSFGQALLLEEGTTNKTSTEGGGASTDWTKWTHWGNRTYWSSESQTSDPVFGNVYTGVTASTNTYLFDYYTYTVNANHTYTISVMLKADRTVNNVSLRGYLIQYDGTGLTNGSLTQTGVTLTQGWQTFTFTLTPTSNPVGAAGFGVQISNLASAGTTIYAARPQFEEKPYATSFTDSSRADEVLTVPTKVLNSVEGTVELRVYVNSTLKNTLANHYIFSYADTNSSPYKNVFTLRHKSSNNSWSVWTTNSAGTLSEAYVADTLAVGWHIFAVRWNAAELALFIDGQKQASVANPNLPTFDPSKQLTFAKWQYDSANYANTLMNNLRISLHARSDAEILADYNSGQPLSTDAYTTYKLGMSGNLLPEGKYFGTNTLKVYVPDSAGFGDYGLVSDAVTIVPNSAYTLSGYIKGNGIKDGSGALVKVLFYNAQDQFLSDTNPIPFTGTFDWSRQYFTFTAPKDAAKVKVQLLLSAHGTAWFDGIQLEQGTTVSRYNQVPNSSAEKGTNTVDSWFTSSFAGSDYSYWTSDTAKEGSKSLALYSATGVDGDWRQVLTVKPNTTYTFTGWVKTQDLQQIDAQVFGTYYLVESDSQGNIIKLHRSLGNNLGTNDWKRVVYTFTTSPSTVSLRIGGSLGNWGQAKGWVWFDGVRLFEGNITDNYLYDDSRNYPVNQIDAQGNPSSVQYDLVGNKISDRDAQSNTTTYTYDRFSRLIKVTDALGNSTTYSYDVDGNKTSETDALGNTTTYQYDLFDRLVRITKPDGGVITYNYDYDGNRVRSIDALGQIYRYKYNGLNQLTTQINPLGEVTSSEYDGVGNLLNVTNGRGYQTSYSYDRLNRVTQIVDPLNHTVGYTYDQKGNIIAKTDANGNTTQFVYDYSGKLTSQVDPLGNVTRYIYDEAGHVIRQIDPNGYNHDFSYDSLGRLVAETDALGGVKTCSYDVFGNLVKVTDQNGNSTSYGYDALKRLVSAVDSLGNNVTYTYDGNGNRKTVKDANGNITTYTYDSLNRLLSVQDAQGNIVRYTYDANNNQTSVTDGRGYTTNYVYDVLNRVASVTDALSGVTSYGYDAAGNRITVTDPNGNTTTYTYDGANRLTNVTDALGYISSYQYDANGNKLQETTPNGGIITSTYDAVNRLVSVTDPLNKTESYTYDNVGNRLSVTDRRGDITNYTYDALNRLTKVSASVTGPGGLTTVETSTTYDPVGNRLSVTDWAGWLAPVS